MPRNNYVRRLPKEFWISIHIIVYSDSASRPQGTLLIYTRWLPEVCQRRSLSGGGREGVATKERLSEAKPLWMPEGGREGVETKERLSEAKPLWREGGREGGREGAGGGGGGGGGGGREGGSDSRGKRVRGEE